MSLDIFVKFLWSITFSECDDGDYGVDCNEMCGHCLQASDCHHITGECSNICKPGYQGIMCDTGNNKKCTSILSYMYGSQNVLFIFIHFNVI